MLDNINILSAVPVYVQIENHVRFAIAAGKLKAGDKLPSVRELSERLGVNPNTIAKGYRDLEVMKLVFTRRGMGVFINEGAQAKCEPICLELVVSRLHEAVQEAKASGLSKKEIEDIISKSLASDSGLYGDLPDSLAAFFKQQT